MYNQIQVQRAVVDCVGEKFAIIIWDDESYARNESIGLNDFWKKVSASRRDAVELLLVQLKESKEWYQKHALEEDSRIKTVSNWLKCEHPPKVVKPL